MRIRNNSRSAIPLSASVNIAAGGEVTLAADALWVLDRPMVRGYLRDKSLEIVKEKGGKVRMTAAAPETAE